jgi:hypothetical protein
VTPARVGGTMLIALIAIAGLWVAAGFALDRRGGPAAPILVRTPPARTTATTAVFEYRAVGTRLRFACSLDGRRFRPCGARRRAYANLALGRHRFCVRTQRARRRSGAACRAWAIVPRTAGGATLAAAPRPFGIVGRAMAPLLPGGPAVPIDLTLGNPNATALRVRSVTMRVASAVPAGCASAIVVAAQLAATPTIPARATRSLGALGVPRAAWPRLAMLDTGADQTACADARIALGFTGRASG